MSSRRLAARSLAWFDRPVTFPPGRERLATRPVPTGSPATGKTIGMTSVIPIVFPVAGDPVGTGLVASLSRPGGNVTGLSNQASDLAAKRLELMREVFPRLGRLAILANTGYSGGVPEMDEIDAAARTLGLEVVPVPIQRAEDIALVF